MKPKVRLFCISQVLQGWTTNYCRSFLEFLFYPLEACRVEKSNLSKRNFSKAASPYSFL